MRLRLRLLFLFFSMLWKKPISLTDTAMLKMRVFPNDVDISKLAADRYESLMELGMMDFSWRFGVLSPMIKHRWVPHTDFYSIRFYYFLRIFQSFTLHTKLVYWDEKTFYFEQKFISKGRVHATGYLSGTLIGPKGLVAPEEILKSTGKAYEAHGLTDAVSHFIEFKKSHIKYTGPERRKREEY